MIRVGGREQPEQTSRAEAQRTTKNMRTPTETFITYISEDSDFSKEIDQKGVVLYEADKPGMA